MPSVLRLRLGIVRQDLDADAGMVRVRHAYTEIGNGPDSPQAAMIYQHATAEADRRIADALNGAVKTDPKKTKKAARRRQSGPATGLDATG